MKRIYLFLLSLAFTFSAFALDKDNIEAITMVSYEQMWSDYEGTLALKNNTDEDIENFTFQITYFDMSGNPLDYKEFSKQVNIAAGMTKKVNIPAYEHERDYSYYKSEECPIHPHKFKIAFKLKDYKDTKNKKNKISSPQGKRKSISKGTIREGTTKAYDEKDTDSTVQDEKLEAEDNPSLFHSFTQQGLETLVGIMGVLFALGISIGMYVLLAIMAQRRERSVVVWLLLSFIISPIIAMLILLCIGHDDVHRKG